MFLRTNCARKLFLLILSYAAFCSASAQLKADFTMDNAEGCVSPTLVVQFTNKTTGASPSATVSWDLGLGNTPTSSPSPQASYRNVGVYTITLTVTDGGKTDKFSKTVTVHANPAADFTVGITKGCIPFTTNFTSTSTPGEGTVDKYLWNFGDNNSKNGSGLGAVANTYTIVQKFDVSLTVTNSFGCQSATVSKANIVEAVPGVKAAFNADKTVACKVGDNINFSNSSTGPGTLTYAWNFGDGGTSTDKSPTYAYNAKGTNSVDLTVTSSEGCSDKLARPSYINIANFTSSINAPAKTCMGQSISFQNTSTPAPSQSQWLINDNLGGTFTNFGSGSNASKYFYSAGNYIIKLVNNFGTCQDIAELPVTIAAAPLVNGFVIDNSALCGAPVNVQFKDTTSSAVSWNWNFSYSGTSTQKEPSFNFTYNGSFTTFLTVTNAAGCSASTQKSFNIQKPNIDISFSKSTSTYGLSACESLTATFKAAPDNAVKEFLWDFGDGTNSTDANPEHSFTKPGIYNVYLTYTTTEGCKGKTNYPLTATVYKMLKADFTSSTTQVCGNNFVYFYDKSTTPVTGWQWFIGEGVNGGIYPYTGGSNISYQYQNSGTYTVKLVASNGVCRDTAIKTNYITVSPPFPKISNITNTCNGTRGNVTFSQTSRQAIDLQWDYGDGTPLISAMPNQSSIVHTYTKSGKYKVVLTAVNGACAVRDSSFAYVLLKQSPVLTTPKIEACVSDGINFQVSGMDINYRAVDYYYNYNYYGISEWQYGDKTRFTGTTSSNNDFTTGYSGRLINPVNGQQDIRLITSSYWFGCKDTTNFAVVKVKGPSAGFSVVGNICFKKPIIFTDTSKAKNNVPLTSWSWNFGDYTNQLISATPNGSTEHIYNTPGGYYPSLTVTDAEGCKASSGTSYVSALGPKANFSWSPNLVQPNTTAYFSNQSIEAGSYNNKYDWTFSYGTKEYTSQGYYNTYTQAYPAVMVDTVRLIARSTDGLCRDTIIKLVPVRNIDLKFTYKITFFNQNDNCPPVIVDFTSTSTNVSNIKWSFGDDGTDGNKQFTQHTYTKPGRYRIVLTGTSINGLTKDSIVDFIEIKGAYATLKSDTIMACSPLRVKLTATTLNTALYIWDMGDGTTLKETGDVPFFEYTYTTPGAYRPIVILRDTTKGGCNGSEELSYQLISDTLHIAFADTPYISCEADSLPFKLIIVGINDQNVQVARNYHWEFGTGNFRDTADIESPKFRYIKPGNYTVKVKVVSEAGCKTTDSTIVVVKPIVKPSITGPATPCEDVPLQYSAVPSLQGSIAWKWLFPNDSIDNKKEPLLQKFKAAAKDSIVLLTTFDGCTDTTIYRLLIHAKPAINPSPKDTVICDGTAIQLLAKDGIKFKWTPAAFINNDSIANPVVAPRFKTTYYVKVTNGFGCENTDSSVIGVAKRFTLLVKDTFTCAGIPVQLRAGGAGEGGTYKWINVTAGLNDVSVSNPIAAPPANPTVYTVEGTDRCQCFSDTKNIKVVVHPLPTINAGADQVIPVGTGSFLTTTASSNTIKYKWEPAKYLTCSNCPQTEIKPREELVYKVTAYTQYGCTATDDVGIKLLCIGNTLSIPNAFTPNRDQRNDVFYPLGKGIKTVKHFVVFSRWGDVIFEKSNFNINDKSAGWDGRFKGIEQPAGVYVFMIDADCDTGEPLSFKGTVTLIR